jgi:hypothetical protein
MSSLICLASLIALCKGNKLLFGPLLAMGKTWGDLEEAEEMASLAVFEKDKGLNNFSNLGEW